MLAGALGEQGYPMKMIAAATLALACLVAPAQAQTPLVETVDFKALRTELVSELAFEVVDEGVDEDGDHYLEVESEAGLRFYLYGALCDEADPAKGCQALNMVATFSLAEGADVHEAMDSIDYAFLKVYRSPRNDLKIARYLVLDGGITMANLSSNITIFADIGDAVWGDLSDADYLED